jgi:phage recombination protein Bet
LGLRKTSTTVDDKERSMSAVVNRDPTALPALSLTDEELMNVLESSLYPGAKPESIKLVVNWCRAQGKDPLKRPVHIVPMYTKTGKKTESGDDIMANRDILMPGIGDYRTDAARTGGYAGISDATWGDSITETFTDTDKKGKEHSVTITYPEWCEIKVYRLVQGQRCGFSSGRIYWKETYATKSRWTDMPNVMWAKRVRGQLEKCAEAAALRRAFPEVGAQPTLEEMEGRVIELDQDGNVEPARQPVSVPKARIEDIPPPPEATPPREQKDSGPRLASAGAIRTILSRVEYLGLKLEEILTPLNISALEGITVDQHIAIMDVLAEKAAVGKRE